MVRGGALRDICDNSKLSFFAFFLPGFPISAKVSNSGHISAENATVTCKGLFKIGISGTVSLSCLNIFN